MARNNETMTLQGFSAKGKQSIDLEQPFSDKNNTKTYGMPITGQIFWDMILRFQRDPTSANPAFKDLWFVEFSKASILRILAQEGCEHVRFFFGIPDLNKKKASLMIAGVDSDGTTIGKDVLNEISQKMLDEKFIQNNERDDDAITKSLKARQPALEERGNGGKGVPINDETNIYSIEDFFEWVKANHPGLTGTDEEYIAKFFLDYVDSNF